jgi:uncharacterized membrane protein YfcA
MSDASSFFFGSDQLAALLGDPAAWWIWALLVAAAALAGLVDTIAGGGGIITLPALLAVGIPPHIALGTNKLQSSFGSLTATLRFRHAGLVSLRSIWPGIAATATGAALGALAVRGLDTRLLRLLIPVLLAGIFCFMLFKPAFGAAAAVPRWPRLAVWLAAGLGLGFYDGFFGPGTGTFWAMVLVGLAGMDLRQATAHTKAVNFTSNIVSLAMFLLAGTVSVAVGLAMGLGQAAGAWIGSHLVLSKGVKLVRVLVLVMAALMIVYLLVRFLLG